MSPALYAFIVSSPAGVSRQAIEQWARRQTLNPRSVLRDVQRAATRGQLGQRQGAGFARVAVSVIYYVPVWQGERSA